MGAYAVDHCFVFDLQKNLAFACRDQSIMLFNFPIILSSNSF